MQKFAKLFVLALCLTLVGSVWAGKTAKGPQASVLKKGQVSEALLSGDNFFTLPEVGSRHPGSLDDIIISEDFEAIAHGELPDGWTQVDVDGGLQTVEEIWPVPNSEWLVFDGTTVVPAIPGHSGDKFAANIYNAPAVPNDDWLILPQQTLTGEITLTFWAASASATWLESFEIKVSTTDAQPASFTETIATHSNIPAVWSEYTFDLSEFAGQAFYVAIHHISNDKLILLVDDLVLEAGEPSPQGTIAGTVTEEGTGTPIEGATVEIEDGPTATTNASGEYTMLVDVGTYTVEAYADGYEDANITGVVVVADQTTTTNFELVVSNTVTSNYPSAATPVNIPDNAPTGANKSLTINDDFLIDDLDITINITHTYIADLEVYLVSPQGDSIQLVDGPTGIPGADFTNTRFDDEAEAPFAFANGGAPYTGSFRPVETLETFDGFSSAGAWRLHVVDGAAQDVGTIGVFTLHVTHEISAVDDGGAGLPTEFAMSPAFPNPFNPSTQISFEVPVTTNAEMKIFNSLGQEVATLFNGQAVAGTHTLYFAADNLPSGLYFAQLTAGSFVSTQKLVLMK